MEHIIFDYIYYSKNVNFENQNEISSKILGITVEFQSDISGKIKDAAHKISSLIEGLVRNELQLDDIIREVNINVNKVHGYKVVEKVEDEYLEKMVYKTNDHKAVIAELYYLLYDLVFKHDSSRIRVCENPECRYIFYDNSKSRSKRFCCESCANLIKVRRYRQKNNEK